MSLATALKKGQDAIDSLGNWDPFTESGSDRPSSGLPVAKSVPANRNTAAQNAAAQNAAAQNAATQNAATQSAATHGATARTPARLRAVRDEAERAEAPRQPSATQARAVLSGKAARPAPAAKGRGKATWLHDGVPHHGRVNAAQYVRELERFTVEETRRAVADTVMDVNPNEIEGVAKLAARIKGRYLAKLLDLGNPSKSTVQDAEVRELTRYRETYEELARGLDMLKVAIEAGDVGVSGMVRR